MDTLLIVEDEKMIRQGIKVMAMRSGVPIARILDCSDGAQALEILRHEAVDGMITDIRMPHMDGIQLVQAMQTLPRIPVTIVLSGYDNFQYAVEMMRSGVKDYIMKPVEREHLYEALRNMEAQILRERARGSWPDGSPERTAKGGQSAAKIRKAVTYTQANYHTALDMAAVANHVSMNYTQFSTAFKEHMGQNFITYLQTLRMDQAKRLLRTTDMKVFEIGLKVGYGDEKHFLKLFRSMFGLSPTEYRRGSKE